VHFANSFSFSSQVDCCCSERTSIRKAKGAPGIGKLRSNPIFKKNREFTSNFLDELTTLAQNHRWRIPANESAN
jgi:hypothetical protein